MSSEIHSSTARESQVAKMGERVSRRRNSWVSTSLVRRARRSAVRQAVSSIAWAVLGSAW